LSLLGSRFGRSAAEDVKLPDYPHTDRSTTESAAEKI
jgi:hypothetical protein